MGHTRYEGPEISRDVGAGVTGMAKARVQTEQPREGTPLSFGQLRLWFLDQLEPGTALYNMPMAMVLKGTLNRNALQRALNVLVARHEALRTRFVCAGEYPAQVVDERSEVEIAFVEVGQGGNV